MVNLRCFHVLPPWIPWIQVGEDMTGMPDGGCVGFHRIPTLQLLPSQTQSPRVFFSVTQHVPSTVDPPIWRVMSLQPAVPRWGWKWISESLRCQTVRCQELCRWIQVQETQKMKRNRSEFALRHSVLCNVCAGVTPRIKRKETWDAFSKVAKSSPRFRQVSVQSPPQWQSPQQWQATVGGKMSLRTFLGGEYGKVLVFYRV